MKFSMILRHFFRCLIKLLVPTSFLFFCPALGVHWAAFNLFGIERIVGTLRLHLFLHYLLSYLIKSMILAFLRRILLVVASFLISVCQTIYCYFNSAGQGLLTWLCTQKRCLGNYWAQSQWGDLVMTMLCIFAILSFPILLLLGVEPLLSAAILTGGLSIIGIWLQDLITQELLRTSMTWSIAAVGGAIDQLLRMSTNSLLYYLPATPEDKKDSVPKPVRKEMQWVEERERSEGRKKILRDEKPLLVDAMGLIPGVGPYIKTCSC
jgi:hypothetical protein